MLLSVCIPFAKFSLEVKDDRVIWVYEQGGRDEWKFSLAPNKNPKEIDFEAKFDRPGGKAEVEPRLGIYGVEGDKMKICFSTTVPVEERLRPTAFTAEQGQGRVLIVLERAR